jgi:glycosyltransferase involved in cell wall biosynthesis
MKIAAYTIALNEEQFVERWYNSVKDADYLLIADTGSTDGTIEKAKSLGINVVSISINPWRFDDARNASLALLPPDIDYCIQVDMDEIMVAGWREQLEKINLKSTRPRYKYVWNFDENGKPGITFWGSKFHARQGYRWVHPVHEVVSAYGIEEVEEYIEMTMEHHADVTKSRSQYLPLLALSVQENPTNDRNSFYYGRELMFYGHFEASTAELKRYLTLGSWKPERAAAMRFIARMEKEFLIKEDWLKKAILEAPDRREAYAEIVKLYYFEQKWQECYENCVLALSITNKPLEYLSEDFAWNHEIYDYAAISAWNIGNKDCVFYAQKALELNPTDERLKNNLKLCLNAFPA